ncbi:MAG: TolC family protein [Treponemataceae bacterium]|nr:TolC family protein [Spirochaetales bacterium]MDY6030406.1 TolC family protein [Treponemataceae bacterium]
MRNKGKFFVFIFIFSLKASFSYSQICFSNGMQAADFAVKNSVLFQLQEENIAMAMKSAKYDLVQFLPSFDFSWSEDDGVNFDSLDSSSKSVSIGLNQILFDGGKRLLSYEMNRTDAYYSKLSYQQNVLSFKMQIISLYYQCLLQKELIKIKEELESNAKSQIEVLKTEYEIGRALENDYLEYLISYKQIQNETKKARRELDSCLRQFNVALNLPVECKVEFCETLSAYNECVTEPVCLEKIIDKLWARFCLNNIDIKKENLAIEYAKKQKNYSEKFYLPEIYMNANVSLNGKDYPLTEPNYSIKFNVNFPNAKVLPVNYSNGYSISKNELSGLNNNSSLSLKPDVKSVYERKNSEISLQMQVEQKKENMDSLYESFFNQITSYDDSLDSIQLLKETLEIQERRLEISEQQLNVGKMTRIDFLQEMTDLATKKIELISSQVALLQSKYKLEILLNIPFGGLENACKKYY